MTLLSMDVSTTNTGWAIFKKKKLESHGCISPTGRDWKKRALRISECATTICDVYGVTEAVLEWPEFHSNDQKAFKAVRVLATLCGRIQGRLDVLEIPSTLVTPSKWKGNLPKSVTLHRCNKAFGLRLDMKDNDVADAIMLGKWHLEI